MKLNNIILILFLLTGLQNSLTSATTTRDIEKLSMLIKKRANSENRLSKNEVSQVEKILLSTFPSRNYIGTDKKWTIKYSHGRGGPLCGAELIGKDNEKLMFFHLVYKREWIKRYGKEDFGKYRGKGYKNKQYFILVGNLEIRAVATSDEYKDESKIKDMLNAFKLSDIAAL